MKQKTFELDERLAKMFEEFCKSRMLIEKRAAAAAMFCFMKLDANERENAILSLERWLATDQTELADGEQDACDQDADEQVEPPVLAGKVVGRDLAKHA